MEGAIYSDLTGKAYYFDPASERERREAEHQRRADDFFHKQKQVKNAQPQR